MTTLQPVETVRASDESGPAKGPRWRRPLAEGAFLLICAETIFSVPYRSVFLATHSAPLSWVAALVVCAVVALCYRWREAILNSLGRLAAGGWKSDRAWFGFWLIFGLAARLAWAVRFRVTLKSDGLAYFLDAKSLATQHTFSGAYWPPGFSLFLAPFFDVFGAHVWVTVLCALLLFAATYGMTYLLAERLRGGVASRIAAMLVAVWPTYVTITGVNCKETLLAFLITAALFLYLKADERGRGVRLGFIFGAGMLLGFCSLTQPGYMLFPGVVFLFELLRKRTFFGAVGRTIVFTLALVAVILPWTYRNYLAFHRVVLISTNGGSVFYRANNPEANASYSAEGEEALPKDEFAADKEGYRAAEAWIVHHPGDFAALMVRKQVVYLGDDGIGVYESMKRGLHPSAKLYGAAKLVCNLFWLAAWVVLLLGVPKLFRLRSWPIWYGICFLPLLYQWAIDSVFESGSRHHLPYVALVSIMVGIVIESASGVARGEDRGASRDFEGNSTEAELRVIS